MNQIIGIDIGGVIIDRVNDGTDTSFFGPNFLKTTAVPGVFDAIRKLVERGWTVHLVSKCGTNVQEKTRKWLDYHHFFEHTGVNRESLHFCRTRPEKSPICLRLGVTHFVDDRLDVLDCLHSVPYVYLFHPNDNDAHRHAKGHRAQRVDTWSEVLEHVRSTAAV